jgi:cytochrome c55X
MLDRPANACERTEGCCWPLNLALALTLIPALTGAAAGEPEAGRQKEILHLLKHDCGSCHGMTLKGGLGPSLRPDVIGERSDDLLIETILNGRPGTPMAPWRISLNADEARWLVRRLKEGINGAE